MPRYDEYLHITHQAQFLSLVGTQIAASKYYAGWRRPVSSAWLDCLEDFRER